MTGALAPVAPSQRLTTAERIRRRTDFQQVYDNGVRLHGRLLTIFVLSTCAPVARIGIAATKKLGGAVVRNRAKRLIREVFRRNKQPGVDVVVVPRREALSAPFQALETDFRTVLARARRQRPTN
jgi:ribonuclease P protein component